MPRSLRPLEIDLKGQERLPLRPPLSKAHSLDAIVTYDPTPQGIVKIEHEALARQTT